MTGRPTKVIKFATDITAQKIAAAEFKGKRDAVNRVQAIIEFDLHGKVLTANDNFLNVMGYALDEVQGQHHAMFCDPEYVKTAHYRD